MISVVGCGGSSSSSSGGGDGDDDGQHGTSSGAVPIEQLPTRLGDITCKMAFSCCSSEERVNNPFIGSTEGECRTNLAALLTLIVPAITSSIEGGRLRYDADAMGECLDAAEAAGCVADLSGARCEDALIPLVRVGGACNQDAECIDSICVGESGDSAVVDGTCSAPLALGAPCVDGSDCASGNCPFDVCEAPLENGADCFSDEECLSGNCDAASVCSAAPDSVCD